VGRQGWEGKSGVVGAWRGAQKPSGVENWAPKKLALLRGNPERSQKTPAVAWWEQPPPAKNLPGWLRGRENRVRLAKGALRRAPPGASPEWGGSA